MVLIKNSGNDRVIDELRRCVGPTASLDIATSAFSLFAFAELRDLLSGLDQCRFILPDCPADALALLGLGPDRPMRNRLQAYWLAKQCTNWLHRKAEVRQIAGLIPQSTLIVRSPNPAPSRVINGNCSFTTEGLGITPGNQFGLIQCSENAEECEILGSWFASLWSSLPTSPATQRKLVAQLAELIEHKAPSLIYHLTLFHVFKGLGDDLDEERIVKSATGIRNTNVWKKLFKFQRDGVVGAIDKLERHGGCIIADSVGTVGFGQDGHNFFGPVGTT